MSFDEERLNTGSSQANSGAKWTQFYGLASPPDHDPLLDTVLADRYHVLSILGKGGMGVVYKARQELLDRLVAIKMLKSQFIADENSVKRFRYEAKAASRLSHPHVITVYDFGVAESGEPYIVMEYLLGESLSDTLRNEESIPVERALGIFGQVCDALDHAHSQGMIHRDLKPGNIMLLNNQNQKDFVKVVDFGIAKLFGANTTDSQRLTQTGEIFGSPVYMSPEQCRGEDLGPASDIYGMGIVMYETLTGKLPFLGATLVETITQHLCQVPPPFSQTRPDLQIPPEVESLVMKCLRKEPSVRYSTMGELAYDIMQITGPSMGVKSKLRPTEEFRASTGQHTAVPVRSTGEPAARQTGLSSPPGRRQSGQFPTGRSQASSGAYRGTSASAPVTHPQWDEAVAGEDLSRSHPIVWILATLVVFLVITTGAVIWAARNGYFAKQVAAPTAPPPAATKAPPPVTADTKPTTVPVKQATPANPAKATPVPITTQENPDKPHKKTQHPLTLRHKTREEAAPEMSTPQEEPVVPQHHFKGDDYSRWSEFRQMERGQSKTPPPF